MNEDCGVCLDPGDYDHPEMYEEKVVKARKECRCCECGRQISIGQEYQRASGKWDGDFGTHKTCLDCMNIRDAFACGSGFMFERLWDDLWEYKNDINHDCVKKIKTPSAKAYYLERLRKMRGISDV